MRGEKIITIIPVIGVKNKLIRKALKNGGKYIEGDYVVSKEKEQQSLMEYNKKIKTVKKCQDEMCHIDIPFSVETQTQLLLEAGFSNVEIIWHENEAAIFVTNKYK